MWSLYLMTGLLSCVILVIIVLGLADAEHFYKFKRVLNQQKRLQIKKYLQMQVEEKESNPKKISSYLQRYWDWENKLYKEQQIEANLAQDYSGHADAIDGETTVELGTKLATYPQNMHKIHLTKPSSRSRRTQILSIEVLKSASKATKTIASTKFKSPKSIVDRKFLSTLIPLVQNLNGRSSVKVYKLPVTKIAIVDATVPNYLKNNKHYNNGAKRTTNNQLNSKPWYKNYDEYLKSPDWQETRRRVNQRANGFCEVCDDRKTRADHVHHVRYPIKWGEEEVTDLLAVCEKHHKILHGNVKKDSRLPF